MAPVKEFVVGKIVSYSEEKIGQLTRQKYYEIEEYHEIDWTIQDIFSCREENESYDSPMFLVAGSRWFFVIFPNGDFAESWISLYLYRSDEDWKSPKVANFSLGVRKVDGTVEMIEEDVTFVFDQPCCGYEKTDRFLERSKLLERRSELAPLTITCTLRVNEIGNFASGLTVLSSDFKKMFTSKIGCDATLKVKNEEFPVHKVILTSRSEVFDAMFRAEMKEKNTGVVDIVDCHPASFKDFLVYIYSGRLEKPSGDIFELYRIAHKYCVEHLKATCVLFIIRNLSVDNVIDAAILGHQFDEWKLKKKSQELFDGKVEKILPTDKWNSLLREDPALANQLLINMTKKRNHSNQFC